ncbi:MAG: hypothetical protein QG568_682 [Patescibacteria group bacterium]|nr:hypothetical protein [Patescibacteria group bacterium]
MNEDVLFEDTNTNVARVFKKPVKDVEVPYLGKLLIKTGIIKDKSKVKWVLLFISFILMTISVLIFNRINRPTTAKVMQIQVRPDAEIPEVFNIEIKDAKR